MEKMGGECSTHGRNDNEYEVWSENLKGRDSLEDVSVVEKIIL
jgi:hypothetical protein